MTVLPLLAVGIVMNLIAVLFVIVSVVLILVILIQKGRGGGLSAAFGGGMASGLLGSKTGDFLTWVTISLVAVFLVMAVLLAKFYKPSISGYSPENTSAQTKQPASQPTAPAGQPVPETTPSAPETTPTGQPAPKEAAPTEQPGATGTGTGTTPPVAETNSVE